MDEGSERGGNIYFFLGVSAEESINIQSNSHSLAGSGNSRDRETDYKIKDAVAGVELFNSKEVNSLV